MRGRFRKIFPVENEASNYQVGRSLRRGNIMRLLKLMLATVLVLDAALVVATNANLSSDPLSAIGFSTESANGSNLIAANAK
jgi:hypothetical protein